MWSLEPISWPLRHSSLCLFTPAITRSAPSLFLSLVVRVAHGNRVSYPYKASLSELSVLSWPIAPAMESVPSTSPERFPVPSSIRRGPMTTSNQVPGQRNPKVFNDLSNDVSSIASCPVPLLLDDPPERISVDISRESFLRYRSAPN